MWPRWPWTPESVVQPVPVEDAGQDREVLQQVFVAEPEQRRELRDEEQPVADPRQQVDLVELVARDRGGVRDERLRRELVGAVDLVVGRAERSISVVFCELGGPSRLTATGFC